MCSDRVVEDVASTSNFKTVKVENYDLDLVISFDKKQISGQVVLQFKVLSPTQVVDLDIHPSLQIQDVLHQGERLAFERRPFTDYGEQLAIQLPGEVAAGHSFSLTIDFCTNCTEDCPGVEWLEPEQTAGKQKPFVYTQGQAVLNRSFFPCQDTPAVKATFTAVVQAPEGFKVLMSANESSYGERANRHGNRNVFYFRQSTPIPVYLVALAAGDLASADIGPRSRVWAEPGILERARAEFEGEVERFLQTGERLFGPYVWGRYDILVMPPSFPFGGMENPCLTFVTPCILVGDKSLTDVVIHEISHSWFGNLVTNANWSEFWLNEGFTMFAQRRIMEELFGRPYMCLEAQTGLDLLRRHVEATGEDHPLNRLRVVIEPGVNPDDTYNETPYEKGFCFVSYLQKLVGSTAEFDAFLRAYVDKFKYQSVVAEDTLEFFLEYFPQLKEQEVDKTPGLEFVETWLLQPGLPPFTPDLSAGRELMQPADLLLQQWVSGAQVEGPGLESWRTYQQIYFLDQLLESPSLSLELVRRLEAACPLLSSTHNSELRLRWALICVRVEHTEAFPRIRQFLLDQGKLKYTKPIYLALVRGSEACRQFAQQVFQETKAMLHVTLRGYVQDVLESRK